MKANLNDPESMTLNMNSSNAASPSNASTILGATINNSRRGGPSVMENSLDNFDVLQITKKI
jgi:hypothetical protein